MRPGIDPKIDYAFKRLFGREQNMRLLIHLLNAVLGLLPGELIVVLELLNPFNDKDALDDKLSILDIKARDQRGRQFNVEMQMLPDRYFPKRVTYYLTRLHQGQLKEGEEYQALQPTFSICFLNAVHWPQVPDYHLTFRLRETRHGFDFTDDLAVHMLELPKFTKSAEELASPLEVWLYFLRHAEALDTDNLPAALQVPDIQHAMGELTMLTQSDLERERYEARVKYQRDEKSRLTSALETGREEGFAQGRAEGHVQGRAEGHAQGHAQGHAEGRIHLCQRLLGKELTAAEELAAMTVEELERLATALEQELVRA